MEPTADDFRALARSSPGRWGTLRFTLTRRPPTVRHDEGVRAWLRRPDLLRVQTLDDPLIRATLVRLDVQTGVCVLIEELGGSRSGRGHVVRIEAVDEPMPDGLFPA